MYRKPGSPGVLKGVLSGPYAGGRRLIDAAKLPRAARQRLADVLTGRAEPTPILHEHPGRLASRFRATWGVLVAIVALATLTAIGFADPRAAWAYQPRAAALGYGAAMMLLALSLLALHRRRALTSGGALVPGRYLLPLDVVEVPPEDADGDQTIVVTPLGAGRDARVRDVGRRSELVIVLDGGAEIRFMLRSEREGEHALRRLEHAQSLLEELTYKRELEKAVANDAFFDVRVDASWASLAPSGPESRATRRRRAFLHGSLATSAALVVAGALGWGAFVSRSWASDRALYLRALRIGTLDALDAYLVRGTSHRDDAALLRERVLAQRAEFARRAAESRSTSRSGFESPPRWEWELTPEEAAARRGGAEACLASVRARASTAHADALPVIEALLARARRTGDTVVPVRVDAHLGTPPPAASGSDLLVRASLVIRAFERIFSETCPASVLRFVERSVDRTGTGTPGLDVRIDVAWPAAPTWPRSGLGVRAPRIVFDVTLRGEASPGGAAAAAFHLTMPAPDAPLAAVRTRSLFVVRAGAADETAYALVGARAFDRLYDEIYGLFFRGDPRVPLREEEPPAVAPP